MFLGGSENNLIFTDYLTSVRHQVRLSFESSRGKIK